MKETRVASRYALSLLDLALDKNELSNISEDIKLILDTVKANKDLEILINSPIVKSDKKEAIFKAIFDGKISKISMAFLSMLAKKRREGNLVEIGREFLDQVNKHKGVQKVIVTTAIGLDDKLRKEVMELVKKNTQSEVELVEHVDKDIIGGFILKIGDTHIDSSVVRTIKKLRRNFTENPYQKGI